MNTISFVAFFACLAAANAGHYSPSAHIIQGPSSKTTLIGPEGSVISSYAPGGQIVHEEHPGYIADAAPVATYAAHTPVASYAAHSPVVSYASYTPVASYAAHAPVVAAAPLSIGYTAPLALGPETHISKYGSHISHGGYSAPVAAYATPLAYEHSPVVSSEYGYYGGQHGAYGGHHGLYL